MGTVIVGGQEMPWEEYHRNRKMEPYSVGVYEVFQEARLRMTEEQRLEAHRALDRWLEYTMPENWDEMTPDERFVVMEAHDKDRRALDPTLLLHEGMSYLPTIHQLEEGEKILRAREPEGNIMAQRPNGSVTALAWYDARSRMPVAA